MNASANIFLGQSEAPLMIRPYLKVIIIIAITMFIIIIAIIIIRVIILTVTSNSVVIQC